MSSGAIPLVRISVCDDQPPEVTLDGRPYELADGPCRVGRDDVRRIIDEVRADHGAIRVEIVEADGSTFTDLIAAPSDPKDAQPTDEDGPTSSGFLPGEPVAVAIIVAEHPASSDGLADVRLPSAILAGTCGRVVLLGCTSGTLAVVGDDQ